MSRSVSRAVPRTAAELAELEARYQPFHGVSAWRACHVDRPRWARYQRALERRAGAAGEPRWRETQDLLLRSAALDSAALDGLLPANPELTAAVLASSISGAAPGDAEDAIDLVAECHRRALILASEAAASDRPVDVNLIAVLQDVITESQATYTVSTDAGVTVEVDLPKRQYKPVSNYLLLPGGELAVFAPAFAVESEMQRLTAELASAAFAALHPVVKAAYAHYAIAAIHPFADGNGRLARTVASIFLLRSAGVPLLVFADQWPAYYQALAASHRPADRQLMADFVATAAMSAMDLAANLVARPGGGVWPASRQRPGRQASASALDEAARGLLDTLTIELRELLTSPPRGVRLAVALTRETPAGHIEPAYRMVPHEGRFGIRVSARARARPGGADERRADLEFVALASELPGDLLPVALREVNTGELLEVALADAYPLVLEQTALRIRLWCQRLLAEALAHLGRA